MKLHFSLQFLLSFILCDFHILQNFHRYLGGKYFLESSLIFKKYVQKNHLFKYRTFIVFYSEKRTTVKSKLFDYYMYHLKNVFARHVKPSYLH